MNMFCCCFIIYVFFMVEGDVVDIFIKMMCCWIVIMVGFISVYCMFVLFVGKYVLFVN